VDKTALIAGGGRLPEIWMQRALEAGRRVTVYEISGEETGQFDPAEKVREIDLGRLRSLIDLLKQDDIDEVIMLGKVRKERLYGDLDLDAAMQKLLAGLPDYQDETILAGIASALEEAGFKILPQDVYLQERNFEPGLLAGPAERAGELEDDFRQGLSLARKMADLEIGQTVLLKEGTVLAVEAVEGTDAAIKRAGDLAGPDAVMAKASRPDQDDRLDIPAIGPRTVRLLAEIKAAGLVLEAGGVFLLEEEKCLQIARKNDIVIRANTLQ